MPFPIRGSDVLQRLHQSPSARLCYLHTSCVLYSLLVAFCTLLACILHCPLTPQSRNGMPHNTVFDDRTFNCDDLQIRVSKDVIEHLLGDGINLDIIVRGQCIAIELGCGRAVEKPVQLHLLGFVQSLAYAQVAITPKKQEDLDKAWIPICVVERFGDIVSGLFLLPTEQFRSFALKSTRNSPDKIIEFENIYWQLQQR